jgi:hypothetical protein
MDKGKHSALPKPFHANWIRRLWLIHCIARGSLGFQHTLNPTTQRSE